MMRTSELDWANVEYMFESIVSLSAFFSHRIFEGAGVEYSSSVALKSETQTQPITHQCSK